MAELRTERLLLRRWRAEDREPFAALNADPAVVEHLPGPLARPASDELADRLDSDLTRQGWGLWALEVPGVVGFAGFVGLARPGFDAAFTPCVEVGWRLARAQWGRGYATEAARACLRFGFEHLDLAEIVAFTATSNVRSRAVMTRLGMTHHAHDDFDHPTLPPGHALERHVLYRLSRGAWSAGVGAAPAPA